MIIDESRMLKAKGKLEEELAVSNWQFAKEEVEYNILNLTSQ